MNHQLLQIITAMLGSAGFALLFNLREKYIHFAALGGAICWGTYLLAVHFGAGIFFASFTAAVVSSVFAEVLARLVKAPVTLFLISTLIPLVPGSSLYYTMNSIISGDLAAAGNYATQTGLCAIGIAAGICAVTAACSVRKESK